MNAIANVKLHGIQKDLKLTCVKSVGCCCCHKIKKQVPSWLKNSEKERRPLRPTGKRVKSQAVGVGVARTDAAADPRLRPRPDPDRFPFLRWARAGVEAGAAEACASGDGVAAAIE